MMNWARLPLTTHVRFTLAFCGLLLVTAVPAFSFAVPQDAGNADVRPEVTPPADSPERERVGKRRRGGAFEVGEDDLRKYRRFGRVANGNRRVLTEKDMKNLIEVADDVAPEWAESLQEKYQSNPESFLEYVRQHGRRLMGFVMLRERSPILYEVRVDEMRCNRSINRVAKEYRKAVLEGRSEEMASIQQKLRELVRQSLDLELRARAMELAELDRALKQLKAELEEEIATQAERFEDRLQEVMSPDPEPAADNGAIESAG